MTTTVDSSREKSAANTEHVEAEERVDNPKDVAIDAAARGQAATGYETLTPWETVKTFKKSTAVCFMAAFSAATDGYQIA